MDKKNKQAGYSLIGVMVSIGLLSGLVLIGAKMSKQVRTLKNPIKRASYINDLKHYVSSAFSCEETLKNVDCSAGSEEEPIPIPTYRESGELLTTIEGTNFYEEKNDDGKYSFVVKADCYDRFLNFHYTTDEALVDKEYMHLFDDIPVICGGGPCVEGVDTLSFEGFEHNDPIDNNQFKDDFGITFATTAPMKIAQNGTKKSIEGGDHAYECGECGSKESGKRYNGGRKDSEHEVGNFFVTDDSKDTEFTLTVDYEKSASEASGIILDLDKGETWIVQAFDEDGKEIYSRTYEGDGKYDGAPLFWKVDQEPPFWTGGTDAKFDTIVLTGKDDVGGTGNFGLAFDNFSPSKICDEFHLP